MVVLPSLPAIIEYFTFGATMNRDTHHGKAIQSLYSDDDKWFVSAGADTLTAEYQYCGDHEIWWAVRRAAGVEVTRYNLRYVQSIHWAPAQSTSTVKHE